MLELESAIAEKKNKLEQLIHQMKEVNLQSLSVVTGEEAKNVFECKSALFYFVSYFRPSQIDIMFWFPL